MKKTNRAYKQIIMFDFEDFDNSTTSLINDHNLDDVDFPLSPSKNSGVEYLSNVDYALNSPLIRDELEEFLLFLKGKGFRRSWNMNLWGKRKQAIKSLSTNLEDIISPSLFHNWFGNKNLSTKYKTKKFRDLINKTQSDSDLTFPILNAFIKGWLGMNLTNVQKNTNLDIKILKWGAYFLDFHIITLFLNAIDDAEIKELLKLPDTKRLSDECADSYLLRTENFGSVLVTLGFAYFVDEKVLMDRNTMLMCKDTYIARFQTLFSMINRVDDTFTARDWLVLNTIYSKGDKILAQAGNLGYNGIKLLEPLCSLKLTKLAHQHRPLIPDFPAFEAHINQSVQELEDNQIHIRQIKGIIDDITNPDLVFTVFGSFRHWGHPYLDYLVGLDNMYTQVTMDKKIDQGYANILASDLAYIVLSTKFQETKRWYVDINQVSRDHVFYDHIKNKTWITPKQIKDFGHHWHELPLTACFEIPDVIDPSLIYSDKSHSMNRSDILNHVKFKSNTSIPSKKVLHTFLNTAATNWREFLTTVDQEGLTNEDLVIGLKGKERELKIQGRFFTLMSWKLREYFVVTEYLIKTFFVPLFKGLTMADDLNTVIKKLMDNSNGQGLDNYENVCIANHIDYTKWNNHQRDEANNPVFKVMGQFLGYPNLISRTHEFFQKSLVYYAGRPDLMKVEDNILVNKGKSRVCWNGQDGGMEGLRQKGWSVVNLLVIRRESLDCNTKIKILAQGDNQVICTQYKLQKYRTDDDLKLSLGRIVDNNNRIMQSIENGTSKLGLIINQDETIRSADFLIYGKVPIYRGNIKGLETKRWSRVTCVTNDQLPTLANTLSTINSNALTVAHFSTSPLNAMIHYNFLGNFGRNLLNIHNPALKSSPINHPKIRTNLNSQEYKSSVLYLDPCLGGACGMSLTRFLIRNFPDPLTESLTFWKVVHDNGPVWVKQLAIKVGNPVLGGNTLAAFKKLMEDPLSINIPGGVNPITLIKEEIKKNLIYRSREVKNEIIRSSLDYIQTEEDRLIEYLRSIKPLFPRFISEYLSGTYVGIVRSLIGLFQNSKTIRNIFSRRIDGRIKGLIVKSEVQTFESLGSFSNKNLYNKIWKCSSAQSDKLRQISWGTKVFGATIPHPLELIGCIIKQGIRCTNCANLPPLCYYISTLVPQGLSSYRSRRGPYKAYLGSRTSESTSILQPWEKETKMPLIKRAVKLRSAIGWFVNKDSKLADSLLNNLNALTGEDWSNQVEGFKRTGSALHRFSCTRQSSAGYSAQSPSKLTWMCSTTDTLSTLNATNYDFMHQTLLIFVQATISELMDGDPNQGYYHAHITCADCLREIDEISLETTMEFNHKDVSQSLEKWKPPNSPWSVKKEVREIREGKWEANSPFQQSYHIGRAEGFLFGDMTLGGNRHCDDMSLFPLSIQSKVVPKDYLDGLLDGLIRASGIHCISRRAISDLKRPKEALLGVGLFLIDKVSVNPNLLTLWRSANFEALFFRFPHIVPPSYPMSNYDLGSLGRNYLRLCYRQNYIRMNKQFNTEPKVWIFSDMNESSLVALYSLSGNIAKTLYSGEFSRKTRDLIRKFKESVVTYKDPAHSKRFSIPNYNLVQRVPSELRHACKMIYTPSLPNQGADPTWGKEVSVDIVTIPIYYTSEEYHLMNQPPTSERIQNPLISGMRLFQFATGSHYKVRSIITKMGLMFKDVIVCGDGSGGISAAILRLNPQTSVIFNSLLQLDSLDLRGTTPSPPSAIYALGTARDRCVNLRNVWEYPSDLSISGTWDYLITTKIERRLTVDLMIIDAEIEDNDLVLAIEDHLSQNVFKLIESYGVLIYKTYINRILIHSRTNFLNTVGSQFSSVHITTTQLTSSQSQEIYIVCQKKIESHYNLQPDLNNLLSHLHKLPAFSSFEVEFKRACSLKDIDMLQGVPGMFLSDPYFEFYQFYESLGIESGVTILLSELIRLNPVKGNGDVVFSTLFVGLNALLHMTSLHKIYPQPLNDHTVYSLGILLCGFLNWLSLCTESVVIHSNVQKFVRQCFLFSWKVGMKTKKVKKIVQTFYTVCYSFRGKYSKSKNFFLDAKMGAIGRWMRILVKLFGYKITVPNNDNIRKILKDFNNALSVNLIRLKTDFFNLIIKDLPDTLPPIDANDPNYMNIELEDSTMVS